VIEEAGAMSPIVVRDRVKRLLYRLLPERGYYALKAVEYALAVRRGRAWEDELSLLAAGLRPGETAIDVGANLGLYSFHFSRAVGRSGRVYAFEPMPLTCFACRIVTRLLGLRNVSVIQKGCGSEPARVEFVVPLTRQAMPLPGLARIAGALDAPAKAIESTESQRMRVEVVRLDDEIRREDDVAFIKCDVEGAEVLVMRGARSLLVANRPTLVCEISDRFMSRYATSSADLLDELGALGYSTYEYDASRRRLTKRDAVTAGGNYVFIHPGRSSRFEYLLASAP
jgi:FkbM family methyltransferase